MRDREKTTALKFGIYDKCKSLEDELLKIEGVAYDEHYNGIGFDLDGFYSNIRHVIIIPKYDIDVALEDYYAKRREMLNKIIAVCEQHGLTPTGDTIEDYGEHYYIVRACNWNIITPMH